MRSVKVGIIHRKILTIYLLVIAAVIFSWKCSWWDRFWISG